MKKILVILILLAPLPVQAASLIINGSFEADGFIGDITATPPKNWDVNIPANFGGESWDGWYTHGDYSLKIFSNGFDTAFIDGQTATISQLVDLTDANEIIFDIKLRGFFGNWDGSVCEAFLEVNNSPRWQSDPAANGEYLDQVADVSSYSGLCDVTIGIKIKVSDMLYESYWALWDFVKLDTFCGGFGYLASDLNRDCYVDFADLDIMAGNWLRNNLIPADDYLDLNPDGYIDLFDFVVFADEWMQCTDWQYDDCVEVPLNLTADINMDGIVNFFDYGILTANWPVLMDEKADIDESGTVDYNDLNIMNAQWLQRSWLYKD